MTEKTTSIKSTFGLHARPSLKVVQIALKYTRTKIRVIDPDTGHTADAKSIMDLMLLRKASTESIDGISTKVIIQADGEKEEEAIAEIAEIIRTYEIPSEKLKKATNISY